MARVNKILVPVDFSECSRAALRYAIFIGNGLGASEIDVLHVWQPPAFLVLETKLRTEEGRDETLAEIVKSKIGQSMKEFLAEVESGGSFTVHGRFETGEPRQAILEVAALEAYDLIVIGVRGETTTPTLGSTVQEVVRSATCPVLTVRS